MILIRADANERIGVGHVMRCLSIAQAFADMGEKVQFITADHSGDRLIHARGFDSICLDSDWMNLEEEGLDQVAEACRPDLLIVDSYFVTEAYLSSLAKRTCVAYIDDLNVTSWDVDFLIDYNIFGTVLDYSGYDLSRTKLFLGPGYVPLRDEFKNISPHAMKDVTDIMVSAGGADPERITEKLMKEVCPRWAEVRFHFVVGALNPRIETIRSLVQPNMILHINEQNMSGLMKACDIAVSAAGSTLYELCACGTPTITYTLADNQLEAAAEFHKQGIMINAGDCRGNDQFVSGLSNELKRLMESRETRQQLSDRMQSLIDGRGAERLTKEIWSYIKSRSIGL